MDVLVKKKKSFNSLILKTDFLDNKEQIKAVSSTNLKKKKNYKQLIINEIDYQKKIVKQKDTLNKITDDKKITDFKILKNNKYIDSTDKYSKKRIYYNIIENNTQILAIQLYLFFIIHILFKNTFNIQLKKKKIF